MDHDLLDTADLLFSRRWVTSVDHEFVARPLFSRIYSTRLPRIPSPLCLPLCLLCKSEPRACILYNTHSPFFLLLAASVTCARLVEAWIEDCPVGNGDKRSNSSVSVAESGTPIYSGRNASFCVSIFS